MMEVLTNAELEQVSGGDIVVTPINPPSSIRSVKKLSGVWGGGPAVGSNRLAYEKYLAALATWQARHPNLDPAIFDSIYFRK